MDSKHHSRINKLKGISITKFDQSKFISDFDIN